MDTTQKKSSSDPSKWDGRGSSNPPKLSAILQEYEDLPVPPHLREQCRAEYIRGRQERLHPSETESTSSAPDTANPKSTKCSQELTVIPTLSDRDPLFRKASREDVRNAILKNSRLMNFSPNAEMIEAVAQELVATYWREAELNIAEVMIRRDAELIKACRVAGGVTADVFALAREKPAVIAGRTLTPADMNAMVRRHAGQSRKRLQQLYGAFRQVRLPDRHGIRYHLERPSAFD